MFFLIPIIIVARQSTENNEENSAKPGLLVNVKGDLDFNELIDQISKIVGFLLTAKNEIPTNGGGRFITGVDSGNVYAFYYHPSKRHRVSCRPGHGQRIQPKDPVWFEANEWAYVILKSAWYGGNRCWYDDE
ncbi:hypothetical protein GPJ56_008067 [Histomonas meleagridis]|uniref:uncharacterized protein n=1 Tax=Histomonas meleagridis TaxID=135588 RepID=UPI00355A46C6|nr:hypothetical protein GPJ56_008067 [Histomonas meleagridis]KAH0797579.1 hypothetical protein GO595_009682 [Histomonas meleagridis]KAH0804183.1 hypothetical protein GO595_003013 [Histomonas meleagridis]